jgi:hypothetical protein
MAEETTTGLKAGEARFGVKGRDRTSQQVPVGYAFYASLGPCNRAYDLHRNTKKDRCYA